MESTGGKSRSGAGGFGGGDAGFGGDAVGIMLENKQKTEA